MKATKGFVGAILTVFVFVMPVNSWAGLFELGTSVSYRKTNFDATRSSAIQTTTGSLAYYFWGLSALQFSYTYGTANQIQPEYTAYQIIQQIGMNLLITMASRESSFRPYLKVGGAYTEKKLRYNIPNFEPLRSEMYGVTPTGGIGFKLMIGKRFAIKAGVDVTTSPINDDVFTFDLEATGGISILF